ncbi:uncharacterized protein LOC129944850 [Eupeodes corollae]|uniref:uncharacterized protein LOC129944850 n=1 Tax=Eupeodes corollae TaxID=290404 RepID=UPI002490E47F|nr:uncharacterized protein LOC129944850 [Eupeodes corollae]
MNLIRIITVLLLLPAHHTKSNNELIRLIERIYLESNSAIVCFIGLEGDVLTDFMSHHSDISVLVYSSLQIKFDEVSSSNVIIVFNDPDNNKIEQTFDSFDFLVRQLKHRKFVAIVSKSYENLKEYFKFFGENKFTRIFGIVDSRTYVYFPFALPSVKIRRLNKDGFLPNALKDLTNFTFRTTIQKDYPRAFRYTDTKGQPQIGGRIGLMFLNFVRRHNATFEEIVLGNSTELHIPAVINATLFDDIDISMNIYGETKGLDLSYPVKFEKWNILIPVNGHLDPYEYFKRPFTSIVWICIGLTLIYITAIEAALNIYRGLRNNIWQSFSQVFLIILGRPLERPINPSYYRIHCQVFLFSFIMGNLYNIYFTSFLTVFINVKQYDTIQELADNHVSVLIADFEYKVLTDFSRFPQGLDKVLVPINNFVFGVELNSMRNTSFAYTVGGDRGEFLIRLQSFYMKPLFRKVKEPLSEFYLGFLLPYHSPFKEILDEFIFSIEQTGLLLKWEADAAYQSILAGHPIDVTSLKLETTGKKLALTMRHLQFGFYCLTMGWIIGLVLFVCELSFERFCDWKKFMKFLYFFLTFVE